MSSRCPSELAPLSAPRVVRRHSVPGMMVPPRRSSSDLRFGGGFLVFGGGSEGEDFGGSGGGAGIETGTGVRGFAGLTGDHGGSDGHLAGVKHGTPGDVVHGCGVGRRVAGVGPPGVSASKDMSLSMGFDTAGVLAHPGLNGSDPVGVGPAGLVAAATGSGSDAQSTSLVKPDSTSRTELRGLPDRIERSLRDGLREIDAGVWYCEGLSNSLSAFLSAFVTFLDTGVRSGADGEGCSRTELRNHINFALAVVRLAILRLLTRTRQTNTSDTINIDPREILIVITIELIGFEVTR